MSYVNADGETVYYWQEDYFTESSAFWTLTFFTVVGIIYAIIMVFVLGLKNDISSAINDKIDEKSDPKNQKKNPYGQQFTQQDLGLLQAEHKQKFIHCCEEIHSAMMQIYLTQSLYMVFFGIILICLTSYWFMPTVKSALVCILAFCMGIIVGALCAFATMKFSVCANSKVILETNEPIPNPVKYSFVVGSVIATLCVSLVVFVFTCMLMVSRNKWNDGEDGEDRPLTPQMYQNMAHAISAFGVGISFACLFYREAAGQSAKGILVGEELIGKVGYDPEDQDYGQASYFYGERFDKDPRRIIDKNISMAGLISNTITTNLIPIMDTISILATLLCSILILFSKVDVFIEEKYYGLYSCLWFVSLSIPVSFGIAWIAGSDIDDEEEITKNTATSVMVQLIIINAVMFLLVLIFPRYVFPRSFAVGDIDNEELWTSKRIYHGDIVWCLSLGILLQTILLCFGEYFTSNYFSPARNTAKDIKRGSGLGFMTAYIFNNNAHFFIFIFIGFTVLLSYCIAGFTGIALTGVGVMSTPVTLISINFLSGISTDAHKLAELSHLQLQLVDRLYKIMWPSRNYGIHTQITNMTGLFFTIFTLTGCALIIADTQQVNIWQGFTLFGFLFGGGVCYLLRAGSVSTCKAICEEMFEEKNEYKEFTDESVVQREKLMDKEDKFTQFVSSKYDIGIMRVYIQIIILVVSIITFGVLFGSNCLIGYLLGMNLVGLNMMVSQIFLGNSIKAAKEFNDNKKNNLTKDEKKYNRDAYFYAVAIEQFPGSSLISYLAFTSLFIVLGILAYSEAGYFKLYIEEKASYFPARSTQWIDSAQYRAEYGAQVVAQNTPFTNSTYTAGPDYDTAYENPTQEEVGEGQTVQDVQDERQAEVPPYDPNVNSEDLGVFDPQRAAQDDSDTQDENQSQDDQGGDGQAADGGEEQAADGGDGQAADGGDGNGDNADAGALFVQIKQKQYY